MSKTKLLHPPNVPEQMVEHIASSRIPAQPRRQATAVHSFVARRQLRRRSSDARDGCPAAGPATPRPYRTRRRRSPASPLPAVALLPLLVGDNERVLRLLAPSAWVTRSTKPKRSASLVGPGRIQPPQASPQSPQEFRKRSECEDSFDYVGSSTSRIRSSSKWDLRQYDYFPVYHYYHCHARCLVSIACLATNHLYVKPPKVP